MPKQRRGTPSDVLLKTLITAASTQGDEMEEAGAEERERGKIFEFRSTVGQGGAEGRGRYDEGGMIVDVDRQRRYPSLAQWAMAIKGRAVSVKPCIYWRGKSLRQHELDGVSFVVVSPLSDACNTAEQPTHGNVHQEMGAMGRTRSGPGRKRTRDLDRGDGHVCRVRLSGRDARALEASIASSHPQAWLELVSSRPSPPGALELPSAPRPAMMLNKQFR